MILIALFQRHMGRRGHFWTIEEVGATLKIDDRTWPRYIDAGDSQGGPEEPVALGIVMLWQVDDVWRAECEHPDGGQVVVDRKFGRKEALDALREAVRAR